MTFKIPCPLCHGTGEIRDMPPKRPLKSYRIVEDPKPDWPNLCGICANPRKGHREYETGPIGGHKFVAGG